MFLLVAEHGEARQRIAMAAPNLGRQAPNAAATSAELGNLLFGKFQDTVGRIGANCI